MALREGPIRKILKGEKILHSPEQPQPIERTKLLDKLHYFMREYVGYLRGQNEANVHFITERLAAIFDLSSDELWELKDYAMKILRG